MNNKFYSVKLDSNINLHVKYTNKFKTNHLLMTIRTGLSPETAHLNALVPMVLKRGTRNCSDTTELAKKLENMYGANFRGDISKMGEVQVLLFGVDVPDKRYLPEGEDLLDDAIELLRDAVFDPAMEGSHLRSDYVEQEKRILEQIIDGLIDDKQAYASRRCIEVMCEGELYGVSKYGRREDISSVTPQILTENYRRLLREGTIDLFAIGDLKAEEVEALARKYFAFQLEKGQSVESAKPWKKEINEIRYFDEKMEVSQGKLVIGCRLGTRYTDDDYPALVMMNGIFGGYPHSKLFQNVREKASLAYYAYSSIEAIKGVMLISAGIDSAKKAQAQEIIFRQLEEMKAGNITDMEIEFTLKAITTRLKTSDDYPSGDVDNLLAGLVTGKQRFSEDLRKELEGVKKEDIIRVARLIQPDTVYFLEGTSILGGVED